MEAVLLPKTEIGKTERNYGIDLLRIVSMLMIIVLHLINFGIDYETTEGITKYSLLLLFTMTKSSVDIFAIISGYVGYTEVPKRLKINRVLSMWLQVAFYSFGIVLLILLLGYTNVNIKGLLMCAFPVSTNKYWYFSSYFPLMILSPWINRFIRNTDKKSYTKFVVALLTVFSLYPTCLCTFFLADSFVLNSGYSFVWLLVMYFTGAWIKKCNVLDKVRVPNAIVSILFFSVLSMVLSFIPNSKKLGTDSLSLYTSITMVLIALSFFAIFSKLKIKPITVKIVRFVTPTVFGVYLIHVHPSVVSLFFEDCYNWILNMPIILSILCIFGISMTIFVVCILIEKVRQLMFKLLFINRLVDYLRQKIEKSISTIEARYQE